MAVSHEKAAPYATISAILDILDRYRNRGMQTPFSGEVLGRIGVTDSLIPRTLQSLLVLDLIDGRGMPTEILEGLRLAPISEYPQRLEGWLKNAYVEVFSYVDPSTDDETAIRDAFRTYTPTGQQGRMVSLFIGLCEEAGIREKTKKESKPRTRTPSAKGQMLTGGKKPSQPPAPHFAGKVPFAIAGLMHSLPTEKQGWTQDEHDKFVRIFEAVLDFCYPIKTENELANNKADEEDDTTDNE